MNRIVLGLFGLALWTIHGSGQFTVWDQRIEAGRKAYSQAQYDEAAKQFAAALQEAEKFGTEDARLATALLELGRTYSSQLRFEEAKPLLMRSLATREKILGPDHPDVARTLTEVAAFYRLQNQHEKAEPFVRRRLAILEKALGPVHPEVIGALTDLGGRLRDQRKFAEAEPFLRRAMETGEKVLGPESVNFTKTLLGLASFYSDQGKYAEAEPLLRRALANLQKAQAYGTAYPNVPEVRARYADLLRNMNRGAEAAQTEN